jgi:hypothetical protein
MGFRCRPAPFRSRSGFVHGLALQMNTRSTVRAPTSVRGRHIHSTMPLGPRARRLRNQREIRTLRSEETGCHRESNGTWRRSLRRTRAPDSSQSPSLASAFAFRPASSRLVQSEAYDPQVPDRKESTTVPSEVWPRRPARRGYRPSGPDRPGGRVGLPATYSGVRPKR